MDVSRYCAVLVTVLPSLLIKDVFGKPNFVIMLMDDMGWGDLGCYGNPARETPNLDRMAEEGILFTDFYTGSAICSPSYTPQDVIAGIPESEVLFPEELQKAGYKNKIVGKWHLGHNPEYLPLKHGFHEWFGAPNCHYHYDDKVMPNIPVYKDELMTGRYYDDYELNHTTGIGNMTQLYIQEAVEFIEEQAKSHIPFLLYWAPDATHTPLYASAKFRGKSERGLYGDAVMELDSGVGMILDKLKELGIEDNTFAFWSSDNGAATYAHEDGGSNGPYLCGKQTTFEGGFRQPAIAWHPGHIKPGQISHQIGKLMDIFPTVLQMADIALPRNVTLDGESLVEHMVNGTEWERPVFYYRGDTLFKVRYGEYKAHFYSWGSPLFARKLDYHYCPGQHVDGLTTEEMMDYTEEPMLFHLGRDPGEKFRIEPGCEEYDMALSAIIQVKKEHELRMERGEPQLNWCDLATQNWAPKGCEQIDRCLKAPPSIPYMCDWPY